MLARLTTTRMIQKRNARTTSPRHAREAGETLQSTFFLMHHVVNNPCISLASTDPPSREDPSTIRTKKKKIAIFLARGKPPGFLSEFSIEEIYKFICVVAAEPFEDRRLELIQINSDLIPIDCEVVPRFVPFIRVLQGQSNNNGNLHILRGQSDVSIASRAKAQPSVLGPRAGPLFPELGSVLGPLPKQWFQPRNVDGQYPIRPYQAVPRETMKIPLVHACKAAMREIMEAGGLRAGDRLAPHLKSLELLKSLRGDAPAPTESCHQQAAGAGALGGAAPGAGGTRRAT